MAITWRDDPTRTPTANKRSQARALRRRATEPEQKLWWHLRHRLPVEGTHFRRQVPIGPYVADFCSLKAKLIVEVDGNQHGFDESLSKDAKRTAYLTSQGFSVLRFSNREVMTELSGVLEAIYAHLTSTPTPHPSPQGGGEPTGACR
ncbi:MAG: endonuclease domain-containing protein [Xanthobacteraceae bacterium]